MPQTDLETMLARRASSAVTTGDWVLLKAIANCLIELETVRLVTGASRAAWDTGRIDHATNRVREVPLINVPMRDEQPASWHSHPIETAPESNGWRTFRGGPRHPGDESTCTLHPDQEAPNHSPGSADVLGVHCDDPIHCPPL